jgi:hypothetical protein
MGMGFGSAVCAARVAAVVRCAEGIFTGVTVVSDDGVFADGWRRW